MKRRLINVSHYRRLLSCCKWTVNSLIKASFFTQLVVDRIEVQFVVSQCSTVVRNCCNGDVASQWEIAIFGHLGLWNPWTDRFEIWHDWLTPRRDNPCQFWWQSVSRGYWANTPLVPLFLSFLTSYFFDSIKQATADTAEPILTRDSWYDVSS